MAVPPTLLITKFYIPQARTFRILRPRLVARLQEGLDCSLTLVCAPAGFGKTTLLCDWLADGQIPATWISLDPGDNDPARFWSYMVAAIQILYPSVGQSLPGLLNVPNPPPIETLLTGLINELAGQPPFVLVLDDYHLVETQAIHNGLLFLIEHAAPHLHLVIASRANPPWPLARLRSRGLLSELRAADLRFTPGEVSDFLNRTIQHQLAEEDVAALEERTEGWIAGLQMVALSLQGRADAHQFIRAFTGSHRFIFDYLVEEVLQRQPPKIQEFLLKTSLLERMSAGLCNAVLEQDNSQEILEKLDQANLFIIPLDDRRGWYRYHHLFASLLRSRLEQTHTEALPAINRQASAWCEQAGLVDEAVAYARASGDQAFLVELLERHILTTVALGEYLQVTRWLGGLPDETIRARPVLCVARGWITPVLDSNSLDQAEQWMQAAETGLQQPGAVPEDLRGPVACNVVAFPVMKAHLQKRPAQEVIELGLQALDFVAGRNPQIRSLLLLYVGAAYLETGQAAAAERLLDEAMRNGIASQNYSAAIAALNTRLFQYYDRAQFSAALRTGQAGLAAVIEPLEQAGWRPPDSAVTYAILGMMMLERNDLAGAKGYLAQALGLFPKLGPNFWHARSHLAYARVLHLLGEPETVSDLYPPNSPFPPEVLRLLAAYQAGIELLRASGDTHSPAFARAAAWANQLQAGETVPLVAAVTLARLRLAQYQAERSQALLPELHIVLALLSEKLEDARRQNQGMDLIEIQVQRARLLHYTGQQAKAAAALVEALQLAEPEGILRPFLDPGPPLHYLLADLRASLHRLAASHAINISPAISSSLLHFMDTLLTGSQAGQPAYQPVQQPAARPVDRLIQPLSERELEILRLLNTPLNTTEIAARLCISSATVRTHVKNIYAKLNVNRRIEAVQRAAELHLL